MKKLLKISSLLLLGVGISGANVFAASPLTATFQVSATVAPSCTFSGGFGAVNFGSNIATGGAAIGPTSTSATLTCTYGTQATIKMAPTNALSGSSGQLKGVLGAFLPYQLTTVNTASTAQSWFAAGYTQPFNPIPPAVNTLTVSAYGWLPSVPVATAADYYSDTITVTVTY